ncbi:hypothetical protein, partial [Pseudomonas luteola]|uniref:hypothetical protein n=1 Tax=Pseudomonas luteola TaxID=47886 RepID=UPI001C3F6063
DLNTLGNLVNGLGQINRYAFHCTSPSEQSPLCYRRNVVQGESITAFKFVRFVYSSAPARALTCPLG